VANALNRRERRQHDQMKLSRPEMISRSTQKGRGKLLNRTASGPFAELDIRQTNRNGVVEAEACFTSTGRIIVASRRSGRQRKQTLETQSVQQWRASGTGEPNADLDGLPQRVCEKRTHSVMSARERGWGICLQLTIMDESCLWREKSFWHERSASLAC
jgi:hypothetical protein